jgi:pentatricopeptide repeat protein
MLAYFDNLLEVGDQVHIRIWNAMLRACCFHQRFDLALDVYYPMLAQFDVKPNTYTYLSIINGLGACNVYERAVDFVYTLRNARVPINDAFYRSIMSTAAKRGDLANFSKFCTDLMNDKVTMTEATAFLAVREFSRAHKIDELRTVMAYYYDCGGQLSVDMTFPVLRAEYLAGNAVEARTIFSSLPHDFIIPKLTALIIPLEYNLGAESLWAFFELVIHLNAFDARLVTVFASNFHRLGNYRLALDAIERGATLGLVFDGFCAQLVGTFLFEKAMPRGVVRVPTKQKDANFVDSLLDLPDEKLFDAAYHIAQARQLVDIELPLIEKAYRTLCCIGDTERTKAPLTRQSNTTIKAFTGINATTFLILWRNCAMVHGYETAWHFAWFMMSGMSSLNRGLAFYAMIEILPKHSYGSAFRTRFAANKIVNPPVLSVPCKRCHQPGHLVQFCGTSSDKSYDKVPSQYVCRLCGERHQIYNCPKYVPKTQKS